MASGAARRKPRENQYLFDLGLKGRKTGITVPDTGIRDENGFEPLDYLFSSPDKTPPTGRKSIAQVQSEASGSIGMDISSGPEPLAVLAERRFSNIQLPIPRSTSPRKTFIATKESPARRHPSLGPVSSPVRGDIVTPARAEKHTYGNRLLDFSKDPTLTSARRSPSRTGPRKLQDAPLSARAPRTSFNNVRRPPARASTGSVSMARDTEQAESELQVAPLIDLPVPSIEPQDAPPELNAMEDEPMFEPLVEDVPMIERRDIFDDDPPIFDDEVPIIPNEPTELEVLAPDFNLGDLSAKISDIAQVPAPQPLVSENPSLVADDAGEKPPKPMATVTKRPREENAAIAVPSRVPEEARKDIVQERPVKRPRSEAEVPAKKPKGRRPLEVQRETIPSSPAQLIRGPPLPRKNRGLFILRRQTPSNVGSQLTRPKTLNMNPLTYWKKEYENEDRLLPRLKDAIRKGSLSPLKQSRKLKAAREEAAEPELEPWEVDDGYVFGTVQDWESRDADTGDMATKEDQIAASARVLVSRAIAGAEFRLAKTLSTPFFGSGLLDIPAGGAKRPKNAQRMQLVFFVCAGRVRATVNATQFRIGAGGFWQVPRGNFYAIENDYQEPAKLFFAQGCETELEEEEEEESE